MYSGLPSLGIFLGAGSDSSAMPFLGIFLGTGSDSSANCLLMSTGSLFGSGGEQYDLNASIMQLRHGQLAEVLLVPLLIITEVVPLLIITELVRRLPEAEDGCYFCVFYFVVILLLLLLLFFLEDYGLRAHMRLRA